MLHMCQGCFNRSSKLDADDKKQLGSITPAAMPVLALQMSASILPEMHIGVVPKHTCPRATPGTHQTLVYYPARERELRPATVGCARAGWPGHAPLGSRPAPHSSSQPCPSLERYNPAEAVGSAGG